jgi:hypothetical protein
VNTNAQAVARTPSEKEVVRMRITFHIGKYTVTIVISETHRKKNNRHSAK